MINTASASILAAVCTAIGASFVALATVLYNRRSDKRRRQTEERDVVGKYRDPLLYACEDLGNPLYHLCSSPPKAPDEFKLLGRGARTSYNYCYLIYLIGRVFCWTFILQNDIRNLHYAPTEADHEIMNILYRIRRTLGDGTLRDANKLGDDTEVPSFQILKGFQASIGEKMSVGEHGSMRCMGYALFWKEWTAGQSESSFRAWFNPLEEGMKAMEQPNNDKARNRIIRFQHLLQDLVEALDPSQQRKADGPKDRYKFPDVNQKIYCPCTECKEFRHTQERRSGFHKHLGFWRSWGRMAADGEDEVATTSSRQSSNEALTPTPSSPARRPRQSFPHRPPDRSSPHRRSPVLIAEVHSSHDEVANTSSHQSSNEALTPTPSSPARESRQPSPNSYRPASWSSTYHIVVRIPTPERHSSHVELVKYEKSDNDNILFGPVRYRGQTDGEEGDN